MTPRSAVPYSGPTARGVRVRFAPTTLWLTGRGHLQRRAKRVPGSGPPLGPRRTKEEGSPDRPPPSVWALSPGPPQCWTSHARSCSAGPCRVRVCCRRGRPTTQAGTRPDLNRRHAAWKGLGCLVARWTATDSKVKLPLLAEVLGSRMGDACPEEIVEASVVTL
ncbi:hypothetical protein NDU88_009317 [Pleurodeles waltl]|uniref:Uncharacterized protein n=1 Tax=Pleurodeles waltl TaxID=8319 RepID=A0AAV7QUY4_PLEWA|nr:hypothetical protein NDU88_009317 [Pleurodeles waltl]